MKIIDAILDLERVAKQQEKIMKNKQTNQIATHIGHDVVAFGQPASLISEEVKLKHTARIKIMSADGCDDGAYFPAQCVDVYGEDSIKQLRDFCNEILEPKP